nr:bifunctional hydroxymethylpyrimidine kinase/phosphomethylpyrimidine kinase [Halorhodospira abdelmalekii]
MIIAGSDSGGGAGIQADLKTVMALGGYASTAITALTAQNTCRVTDVHPVPPAFIRAQIETVLNDIGADCIKTGMLHDSAVIETVAATLEQHAPTVPKVIDPVMVAQSGDRLIAEAAIEQLRSVLLPQATLLTPNLPEAEVLLGEPITTPGAMAEAAVALRALGPEAVLLKGGHAVATTPAKDPGDGGTTEESRDGDPDRHHDDVVIDILATSAGVESFRQLRLSTTSNHGTGCTLASAIATGLAQGLTMPQAVARARAYLHEALQRATGLGRGHGPVAHGITVRPFVPTT